MIIDTEKTIVPNWFEKEHIEEMTSKKITKAEFEEFHKWIEKSTIASDISDDMRAWWFEFKKERKG